MSAIRWSALVALLVTACDNPGPPVFAGVSLDPQNKGGVQFETPTFDVPQGQEVQDCYFINAPDLNNGQPYYIDRVRIGANPGSHHTNVFRVKTIVKLGTPEQGDYVHGVNPPPDGMPLSECFKSGNWSDWPLVANSQKSSAQDPYLDWHLPTGVAYLITPGERLMVQSHFVNATTQQTPFKGKAIFEMYRSTQTNLVEMGTLFATQQSIRICQSTPNPTYHGTCLFKSNGVTLAAANGHFHSRGVDFEVFKWDGTSTTHPPASDRFYQSQVWNDPPMSLYPSTAAPQIPANGGIWWDCEYQWQPPDPAAGGCDAVNARDPQKANDCCYTFGPVVETSEHCNAFIYYYPKVANAGDVACF
jgi:hypothetical protein